MYIFGNGPSLNNDIDLVNKDLSEQNIFVVNDFALHSSYSLIKPKHYLFADPCYWDNTTTRTEILETREKVFNKIIHETKWEMTIFIPYKAIHSKFKPFFEANNNIKICFYNTSFFKFHQNLLIDTSLKYNLTATTQNVVATAIYLSINIGYDIIHLFGADHSWTEDIRVNNKNEVCFIDKHFYDSTEGEYLPWKKPDGSLYSMYEILKTLSSVFSQYNALKYYSLKHNISIYNCTKNSYIDSFERKILEP